jgi:hypothetical protein
MPEHEVACWSEPAGEKCGEGETAAGRQPPRALGYGTTTSSWRRRLRVAEAPLQENTKPPDFYDTCTGAASRAVHCGSFVREGFGHSVVS